MTCEDYNSREPQYDWEDITHILDEFAAVLDVGEMINTPEFNLGEVMSAVEIMDPKMDGGYGLTEAMQIDEMVDAKMILEAPTDKQALEIIDQLLATEFTWFSGFALPQTLYTCVYIHKPSLLTHKVLGVYLKALKKSCLINCSAVSRAEVREDEEFIPIPFAIDLGNQVPVETCIQELQEVIAELDKGIADGSAEEIPVSRALLSRLRYRMYYLMLLSTVVTEKHDGLERIQDAEDCIAKCQEQLELLVADRTATNPFLTPTIEVPEGAFSIHCLRWVQSPSPMRSIDILTWAQTEAAARKFLKDLKSMCRLAECKTLPQLLSFFHHFSQQGANVPARSYLWLMTYNVHDYRLLNNDMVQNYILQSLAVDYGAPLYSSMAHQAIPAEPSEGAEAENLDSVLLEREVLYKWLDKASSCIWLILHGLCANRSRLRRKLANLLPELGVWQHQSWETDSAVFANYKQTPELADVYSKCFVLTAYAYDIVLYVMSTFLFLGFELDLYKRSELQSIYWYLDYIIGIRFDNFDTLYKMQDNAEIAAAKQQLKQLQEPARGGKNKNKKSKEKEPVPAEPLYPQAYSTRVKAQPPLALHYTLEATNYLCRALFRFLAALTKDGAQLDRTVGAPLGTMEHIFDNRMKPFLYLMRPHYVRYETYIQHADTKNYKTADLVASSVELLKRTQMVLQRAIAELPDAQHEETLTPLLKVTKANILSMQLYLGGHGKDKDLDFDWSFSPSFPVIKFKKKVEKISAPTAN